MTGLLAGLGPVLPVAVGFVEFVVLVELCIAKRSEGGRGGEKN